MFSYIFKSEAVGDPDHLSYAFDYSKVNAELPRGIELAYDGMRIE
jgi:hypothetical protein